MPALTYLLLGPALGFAVAADVHAQTTERYIPVELWAGVAWDGKTELKMPPVDGTYWQKASYTIKGPIQWKDPVTGETSEVYERLYFDRQGSKRQLFTINAERSGLGRLYDGRPGRDTRTSSGGLKFPVGLWKEGETRRFVYKVWDGREGERVESITIRRIDFTFEGTAHCLEFYWEVTDARTNRQYDQNTYIYCPGKSMVSQVRY